MWGHSALYGSNYVLQSWQSWNDSTAPKCLSKPSFYSNHLRLTAILEEEME